MMTILLAGSAAVIGALMRYGLINLIDRYFGWTSLKVSTLVINVSGAFLLGWFTTALVDHPTAFIFSSGVMGGYTTFSTYINETLQLQERHLGISLLYFVLTLVGGLIGAFLGLLL